MVERAPILLLPGQPKEGRRKPGGGGPKHPLVPVTDELRGAMRAQLSEVEQRIRTASPLTGDSVPLSIQLRESALAKTKRPTDFLASKGIDIAAAAAPGQLIADVDVADLPRLSEAFRTASSKQDIYAVSTIESFDLWHPFLGTVEGGRPSADDHVVEVAADHNRPLRLDFFPWLNLESPLTTGQQLLDYLSDAGFHLRPHRNESWASSYYFMVDHHTDSRALDRILGIRNAVVAPNYSAYQNLEQQSFRTLASNGTITLGSPPTQERPVGVLDSGIDPGLLDPWVAERYTYDVGPDLDTTHGTFVAGLIAASRSLNGSFQFPADVCRVVDAQVLPQAPISEDLLLDRIEEVLEDQGENGPRVWNCSFAAATPLDPVTYSPIAQAMDGMSKKYNVLFAQAAGNYVTPPGRSWPPVTAVADGIASPADAVRSLTVGSLAHKGGQVPVGAPASYSRRGPSFGGQQKPDVVHWSGDFTTFGVLNGHGVQSLAPGDVLTESVGTSFATPVVSAVAANIWEKVEGSEGKEAATPELVKGLVVHAAALNNSGIVPTHRSYFGSGVPAESEVILGSSGNEFTTVHDVTLSRGVDWLRNPFPVPACLLTKDGKLRGEIIMTVSYAPVIDSAFGEECVRTSVDASFGRLVSGKKGPTIKGIVPADKDAAPHAWESEQIAEGKWSPVRTYRAAYPRGHQGGEGWGMKLTLLEREDGVLEQEQRVFVILTLRGLSPDLPVYQDGVAAITRLGYPSMALQAATQLRLRDDV